MSKFGAAAVIATAALSMMVAGCSKKVAATAPPAPAKTVESAPTPAPQPAPQQRAEVRPTPPPQDNGPKIMPEKVKARVDELLARIEDAYFDYDKHTLRPDAVQALQADSTELRDILKDYPNYKLTIEGHCDERGSAEYNMALGEKRAEAARDYLAQVGIPGSQLGVVSYGKEKPVCDDHDEACWQKNRRVHIVAMAQSQ